MTWLSWVVLAVFLAWFPIEAVLQSRLRGERPSGTRRDRGSLVFLFTAIGGAALLSFAVPLLGGPLDAFSYRLTAPPALALVAVLGCAMAFRVWSIHSLGRFYRLFVHVAPGQRVVRTGPYGHVRHPLYLATLVQVSVLNLALVGNLAASALFVAGVAAGLAYRIRQEEAVLTAELGAEYADYAAVTPRLIPLPPFLRGRSPEPRPTE
ncbi:isoprenylcysteine carboxylmethyltransferase family protein [Nocardiopsis sp. CNT-189]|uniref:methyltransferase family protein n=1 Tax=Nocardiopsis oceanisediminis TaxID=2816862 RepID=UPI003B3665F9